MRNVKLHRPFKAVKKAVPVEAVARRYTTLKPLGGRAGYTGRCPLPDHPDEHPSFYIYPPDQWWCYGCGRGGDVIDLEFFCGDHGELYEAMLELAYQYNVKLPEPSERWKARQERQRSVRDRIEQSRAEVLRRRLFRVCILPIIDATATSEDERRAELERAWQDFQDVPVEDLLDKYPGGA